jgi:O-antigen/teichoic acid export membrane protein
LTRKLDFHSTSYKYNGLSLRKNFSWNLVGNIAYAGCQWGILVILAKLTSPEMVGRFALGLAVTAPIIMLSNLQLRGVQATDARGEYLFGHYLGLRLITTLLALLIITTVVYLGTYSLEAGLVILAVGFSKAFESISDVYYGFMQRCERMDRIAKSRMIKGPLSLCALGAMVYTTGNVLWGVVGLALTWALILVAYDLPGAALIVKRNIKSDDQLQSPYKQLLPKFDLKPLLKLAWLALPLGIVMWLLSLMPNIPRYFIEYYWGEKDLGIFAALAYLIVAGNTVIGAMGQSATPRLANYYAAGEYAKFRRLLFYLITMGVALGVAGVGVALLVGRPLLSLLYGPEYAVHVDVFGWLMASGAVAFVASFLGYGMTAARYFRVQMPLFIIVTGVTAIASWLLIPEKGALGAAFSLSIGASVQVIGSALVIFHALNPCNVQKK